MAFITVAGSHDPKPFIRDTDNQPNKRTRNLTVKATKRTTAKLNEAKKRHWPNISNRTKLCLVAGIAVLVGVGLGKLDFSGPATSKADDPPLSSSDKLVVPVRTPAIEPTKPTPTPPTREQQPRNHGTKDSLVISDNTGTINVGGTHYHGTPAKPAEVTIIREMPVIVQRRARRSQRKINVSPESRLGRTLQNLKRIEDMGFKIVAE